MKNSFCKPHRALVSEYLNLLNNSVQYFPVSDWARVESPVPLSYESFDLGHHSRDIRWLHCDALCWEAAVEGFRGVGDDIISFGVDILQVQYLGPRGCHVRQKEEGQTAPHMRHFHVLVFPYLHLPVPPGTRSHCLDGMYYTLTASRSTDLPNVEVVLAFRLS
ncbi:hypothetical protein E2C01_021592 [Portunus trituberculatus]|uniref:Uncharacterized protein n=1 Tax=Portunus trituberculatus TaxID=210409 RepID=A0A5B7E4N8_PORTR|nr:hypothetical protein [Portunus trituberculatus]